MKKTLCVGLSAFFLFLFAIFTIIVKKDLLRHFDFNTTVRLQEHTPLRFDPFFSALSVLGRFEYMAVILVLLLVFRRKIWGAVVFIIFAGAHVIEIVGKTFLDQPPPPHMFLRSQYSNFPGLYVSTEDSYPSGHSFRSIFLAVVISYLIWRSTELSLPIKLILTVFVVGLAFTILYSRITLGEHWTSDVIGGALLGLACSIFSLAFL